MQNPVISIASTAYNEEEALPLFLDSLIQELDKLKKSYDYEIVICDNGSHDKTIEILKKYGLQNNNLKYVSLWRNFGHQGGLLSAMSHCEGDLVITMDADGQHPPSVIPKLVKKWEEGFKIVNTTKANQDKGIIRKLLDLTFYKIMFKFTGMDLGQADFRLIDGDILKNINHFSEKEKFIRGLVSWHGGKEVKVEYNVSNRIAGTSKFKLRNLIHFALHGIVSFSILPLRLVSNLGLLLFIPSTAILIWFLYVGIKFYFFDRSMNLPAGWVTLSVIVTFFGSIQLLSLGVIGEYIGKIYLEVKGRPPFLIKESSDKESSL